MVRKTLDYIRHGTTLWSVLPAKLQAVISTGAAGVSGYFAYESGGIALAMFIAAGVFAFTAAGFYYTYLFHGSLSIFERVVPTDIHSTRRGWIRR